MIFQALILGICITALVYLMFGALNKFLDWLQEHSNVTTRTFLFWLFITLLISTAAFLILIQEVQ